MPRKRIAITVAMTASAALAVVAAVSVSSGWGAAVRPGGAGLSSISASSTTASSTAASSSSASSTSAPSSSVFASASASADASAGPPSLPVPVPGPPAMVAAAVSGDAPQVPFSSGAESVPVSAFGSAPRSVPGSGAVVVAIGDSIMDGHGLDGGESWPDLVSPTQSWTLTNLSTDGSGFLMAGAEGNTFQAQADVAESLNPDVVIVSSSSNDLGLDSSDLAAATRSTFTSLRAALPTTRIIALSAFWGDTEVPAELQQIDEGVRSAALAVGGTYVDIGQPLADQPGLMQDDDVHPTADGEHELADTIGPLVRNALSSP
ncbi:SGNH/GDSL hydrolase family protein [Subtercola sp. RTI3]|uniref:SGNH/GDSL hydrolase family protein n=1 Tax=Subtercola sp. RTI3 TaxID=3048639 RepID=UPI002B23483F|nr:SGNH/GDSL hydrolase family protein [Subtercola sp. RTI3]MEA9987032.1 SGNH/GDSL hydrolase family protein [Subtercola sp. RTI3]